MMRSGSTRAELARNHDSYTYRLITDGKPKIPMTSFELMRRKQQLAISPTDIFVSVLIAVFVNNPLIRGR